MVRRGLSLIELVCAVGVLAVALLGTASALHFGFQASKHGALYTQASGFARTLMEAMLNENRAFSSTALPSSSSGLNDAAGVTRPLDEAPFHLASYKLRGYPTYRRHIEVTNFSLSSDPAAVRTWKDDLRQVSVTVSWTEKGRTASVTLTGIARRPR